MFMVIGSNMVEAHPVAATYVKNAVQRGAKLIVVDPRRHPLVDFATAHVQIRVGSDIAFLNAMMHVLIEEDLYDQKFISSCTVGFEELKEKVSEYPPERAAEICGVSAEEIRQTARLAASVKPMMLCYTLGITEHTCGRNNVLSVANLQMLLGNMGRECGGVNPLRGQNNVQGACDMGALPNVFPGYQKVTDAEARAKFEAAWGGEKLPENNGLMIPQMMEGLPDGRVRGFYIFGENLANTEPDIRKVEHELSVFSKPLAGIKYGRLSHDGLQWPCTDEAHPGTCFLHKEGDFTCGLGVFTPVDWTPPAEVPCSEYPLVLSTGRRLTHYHTRTQTGRCEGLNDILGEETADISFADARKLGIRDGEEIRVVSRRGAVKLRTKVTHEVPEGLVWMAFHFREACANWLTIPAFDPVTLTAEYKACAVRVEKLQSSGGI